MAQTIDHLFILIEPGGPETEALKRLGLSETHRRAHPGQGTANLCFAFDNLFLELLWVVEPSEVCSPAIARTRLWERSRWRDSGACPVGMALRGDLSDAGLATWAFRPPYLPEGMAISVACASDDPALPMVFAFPGHQQPADWPEARRGQLQRTAGWGAVQAVALCLPQTTVAAPLVQQLASIPQLSVLPMDGDGFGLRLVLADAKGRHTHTLELVTHGQAGWGVSLVEEGDRTGHAGR